MNFCSEALEEVKKILSLQPLLKIGKALRYENDLPTFEQKAP